MKKLFLICLFCSILFSLAKAQQLEYFITRGLMNNPMLNEYNNNVRTSVTDSLLVAATNKPQVNSNSQILYAPSHKSFGYDEAVTNGGNYSSVVDVSQYIFNRRDLKNRYESINLQKQKWQNGAKISAADMRKVITNLYLTTYADYNEVTNSSSYLTLMNQHKEILKQLVQQGIYRQSDYLSLVIEVQTAEIDLSRFKAQLVKDVYILRQICGIDDTTPFAPEMPALVTTLPVNPGDSPLFKQYKLDSLRIINERQSFDIRYVPKISWFSDAGIMSSDPARLYKNVGYSLGLNMSFPIFDGHQRKLDRQKFSIQENTRSSYENYFKIQYSSQVKQLNAELYSTRQTLDMLNTQLSTTKELVSLLKSQMNEGNVSIIELIGTMKNYISVNRTACQLQMREFEIINELNYLMQQ
ncbi:MAG: TolC family protein [Rikenellaceae bacterium]